ncbi:hypothetical protein ACFX2G_031101 [Malus domestica]
MEKAEESMLMVEESEEVRVPPSGGNPFLKKAYFLKPTSQNSSIDIPLFKLPPFFSSLPSHFKPKKWPLKVNFRGWLPRESNHWKTGFIKWLLSTNLLGRRLAYTNMIYNDVISVAIHLARGTRIALTPAVLTSIYRDLGVLKKAIVDSNQLESSCGAVSDLVIRSPFQLVQVWAWERFSDLRPENPNHLNNGEPRMARWDKMVGRGVENLRKALDSAGEEFLWRPYALDVVENWHLPEYYPQKEKWVSVGPDSGDELQSFVRCLRYYRALLSASGSYAIWIRSSSSFTQLKHKRYYTKETKKWWNQSVSGSKDECEAAVPRKEISERSKSMKLLLLRANHPSVPSGFPSEHKRTEAEEQMDEEDKLTISEFRKCRKKHESSGIRQSSDREKLSGQVHKMVSPVAEECCVNTMKSDEGFVRIAGDGCASSTSLFEKKLLELKAGCATVQGLKEWKVS